MATKSLILRPTGDYIYFGTLSSSTSHISTYPEKSLVNNSFDNFYNLLNEETPDDDSTYIEFLAVKNYLLCKSCLKFDWTSIDKLRENITKVNIHMYSKPISFASDTVSAAISSISLLRIDDLEEFQLINSSDCNITNLFKSSNLNTYVDHVITSPILDTYIKNSANPLDNIYIGILPEKVEKQESSGSKATNTMPVIRVSSIYLEILYEDSPIFYKKDNLFRPVPFTDIYKKVNNEWIKYSIDIFNKSSNSNIIELDAYYELKESYDVSLSSEDSVTATIYCNNFNKGTYTLVINGTGSMKDFDSGISGSVPWESYRSGITSIEILDGVVNIGEYAFSYSYILTSVKIGSSVLKIGDSAFYSCKNLESIRIPDNVIFIGSSILRSTQLSFDNSNYLLNQLCIDNCILGSSSPDTISEILTDGVRIISSYAYSTSSDSQINTNITELFLSDTVMSIGDYALEGFRYLRVVRIPKSVLYLGNSIFWYNRRGLLILCEAKSKPEGWVDTWNGDIGKIVWDCSNTNKIDNSTEYAIIDGIYYTISNTEGAKVLSGDTDSENIVIPDMLTYNGKNYEVTYISENAFYKTPNLKSLTVPFTGLAPNLTTGPSYAQMYYMFNSTDESVSSNLEEIIIGGNQSKILSYSFQGCINVKRIVLSEGIKQIAQYAFYECKNLEELVLPSSLESLNGIFYNCSKLKSINYRGTVEQWNSIEFSNEWSYGSSVSTIVCSDGVVSVQVT